MTYWERALAYQAGVLDGSIVAGKWVRLACERNARDLARAEAAGFDYHFDEQAAEKVCASVEMMPHVRGPKARRIKGADGRLDWARCQLEDWQCFITCVLYGWKQADGLRRFRVGLIFVARKNGKTFTLAAYGNYHLTADGEAGPEIVSAATTKEQAKLVAGTAHAMALRSPEFCEYFGVIPRGHLTVRLDVPSNVGSFAPLAADAGSLEGLNPCCALVDELHVHSSRKVWDVLESAMGARVQPLLLGISTAGVDVNGIAYELQQYGHKVLEGTLVDDRFFAITYSVDDADAWDDEAAWPKANPNLGVSVSLEDMRRAATAARHSPAAIANFRTKRLNVWTQAANPWLDLEAWKRCAGSVEWADFHGARTYIGVDVAQTRDIAAIVAVGLRPDGRRLVKGEYYLPSEAVSRSPIATLSRWVADRHLIATKGNVCDYGRLLDNLVRIVRATNAELACFDRALAAQLMQEAQTILGEDAVIEVGMTVANLNPSMQAFEHAVLGGMLTHDGNPVLSWMMANVVVQINHAGEIYPRKTGGKYSHNKIDGAVAAFLANKRLLIHEPTQPDNPYLTRGIEFFDV